MRNLLLAAAAVLALGSGSAHAGAVIDPVGDFGPFYIGPQLADLDVTGFSVLFDADASEFQLIATFAGAIQAGTSGFYVFGVNTGTGPLAPFGGIDQPNVRFNQAVIVEKTGAARLGANNFGSALISGDTLSVDVPLALLPSTGFTPGRYGWNLWPRLAGGVNQISDFAPENALLAAVPEPAAWALMISGFALVGGAMRHRRRTKPPVGVRA